MLCASLLYRNTALESTLKLNCDKLAINLSISTRKCSFIKKVLISKFGNRFMFICHQVLDFTSALKGTVSPRQNHRITESPECAQRNATN